jgi:hypothetical protein
VAEHVGDEVVKGRDTPTRVYKLIGLREVAERERFQATR